MRSFVMFLVLTACGAAGEMQATDEPDWSEPVAIQDESPEETQPEPVRAPVVPEAEAQYADSELMALRVSPDEWLVPYVQAVAAEYENRLGISIVIDRDGIPIRLTDLPEGLGGQALDTHRCHGFQCNDSTYGARIWIDEPYAERVVANDNVKALLSTIAHEIGHVISGWGACSKGLEVTKPGDHLLAEGHMMSSTADSGMFWDSSDNKLLCSCGDCEAK